MAFLYIIAGTSHINRIVRHAALFADKDVNGRVCHLLDSLSAVHSVISLNGAKMAFKHLKAYFAPMATGNVVAWFSIGRVTPLHASLLYLAVPAARREYKFSRDTGLSPLHFVSLEYVAGDNSSGDM